jgi:hypothetical protein
MLMEPPWRCWKCGRDNDTATPAPGSNPNIKPREGDISLCFGCAELHVRHAGRWCRITDDELIDLPLDHKKYLSALQASVRQFHKQWRG